MSRVLVTGANGFIGSELINALINSDAYEIVASYKQRPSGTPAGISVFETGELCGSINWTPALVGTDTIIHLAGLAHVPGKFNSYEPYHRINVEATTELARQAIEHGARRFIFISSIGVNGTSSKRPFNETDEPNPTLDYTVSKYHAEQQLTKLCKDSSMDLVIVRPPLVYGANAPGNFRRLINLARLPFPLPLAHINNKRSLISLANLVDFITHTINHPKAANQLFLISDGTDISTSDLVASMRRYMGKSARLFPVPSYFWKFISLQPNMASLVNKLLNNLQVDSGKARSMLGWEPPQSLEHGLEKAVSHEVQCR